MSAFEQLVDEAEMAAVDSWDFGWLDGRAVEERPTWRYFDRVAQRVSDFDSLLEVQAGTGSLISRLPSLPARAVASEGYPPSVAVAAPRLRAAGVSLVVVSETTQRLPFRSASFDMVISRHPVEIWWAEIARVLTPGGTYLAQHVGSHSLRSLSEFFLGPLPDASRRDPEVERNNAERAGLLVLRFDSERPRTAFFDVGAIVYFLRLVPWIVPGFTVDRYRDQLQGLHQHIERNGAFETTASRTLVEARKPAT